MAKTTNLSNWSGNLIYSTKNVFYPIAVEEIQELVKTHSRLKVIGSRHSFNEIADSAECIISLEKMNKIVLLDKTTHQVTVEAGMRYGELAPFLHENGYGLQNLASLPHITVVGACTTATHGSGIKNGNLATAVSAIEFINANGEVVTLSKKDNPTFLGAVVSLGAIGVTTKITLNLVPTFSMNQLVYLDMPMGELENNFETIMASGYSVSLFTDWSNKTIDEIWIKSIAEKDSPTDKTFFGASLATQNMHPIANESAENVTQQMGIAGPWYERMPHFKMGFKPSAGKELQSEYFVAIEHGYKAMMEIEKLHEQIQPYLFISEIRTIAADDLWMSPHYKKTCVAFHFTWKQEIEQVMQLLPLIEKQLAPFNAIPHWGKLFTMQPSVLQSRFEKLTDFKKLVDDYDPTGKFRNDFLRQNLYKNQ